MSIEIRVPASGVRSRMSRRASNEYKPCHDGRKNLLRLCGRTNLRHLTADDLNTALRSVREWDNSAGDMPSGPSQNWFIVRCVAPYASPSVSYDLSKISIHAVMGSELADVLMEYDIVFY